MERKRFAMKTRWIAILLTAGLLVQPWSAAYAEEDVLIGEEGGEAVGSEVVIEEEQASEEDPWTWDSDEAWTDGGSGGEDADAFDESDSYEQETEEADGIIEDNDSSEFDDIIEDLTAETLAGDFDSVEEADTVELEDATVVPDNVITTGSGAKRLMRAFSLESYDGCFGNQLSGAAAVLWVEYYVTGRSTGQLVVTFDKNTTPITFDATVYQDSSGSYLIDRSAQEYKDYYAQALYAMQSSGDAFQYDHSEIFWIRGGGYSVAPGKYYDREQNKWVGYLAKVVYTPNLAFDGADGLISAYDAAVAETAAQIAAGADYDGNGRTDELELAMAAHDYLCERLYYDNSGLSRYNAYVSEHGTNKGYDDFRIFVSAGGFLDRVGVGVVCEGYARAYKVICDQFGIPCVLIGGTVVQGGTTIGHMWNGVLINGKWYLTDVTWDDAGNKASYKYFMVGNITSGRTSSGNFSGSSSTKTFTYPLLETEKIHLCEVLGHNYSVTIAEATCTEKGHAEYVCTRCGAEYQTEDEALGHAYEKKIIFPTCTTEGYTIYTCSRCGDSYQENRKEALGHYYKTTVSEPSCTVEGYKKYQCIFCGSEYSEILEPLGHDYQTTVTDPTCLENGYTTYTCGRCGDSYQADLTEPLGHDYQKTVTDPTCLENGYTTYTCGRCDDSYQADFTRPLGHSFENGRCIRCDIGDSIANAAISSIAAQVYTGKEITPSVTVKFGTSTLKQGSDFTVAYRNNLNAGAAYAVVTGKGNYSGSKTVSFTITPKSVAALEYSPVEAQVYSGKAKKPAVTVKDGTAELVNGQDYSIAYSNNKQIGTAIITITGKGSYTGTKTITFKINPKAAALKKLRAVNGKKMTVSWKKVKNIDGYQLQYSTSSKFKTYKTKKIKAGTLTKTISKLKKGKTYYVRIRTYKKESGKTYYSTWSKAGKVKITG